MGCSQNWRSCPPGQRCTPTNPIPTGPPTPRTTPALVQGIIIVQPGVDLTPFIATANIMTTAICSNPCYSDGFVGSEMELIERWLAAHFYALYDQQWVASRDGSVSVRYEYKIDYGLQSTRYGQQALIIDYLGNLAKVSNSSKVKRRIRIGVRHLGPRFCAYPGYAGWLGNILNCPGWGGFPDITIEQ